MKIQTIKQRLYLIGVPSVLLLSATILWIDRGAKLWSGAGLVDVLYFTITTLTSVGYGDITPQLSASRLVSIPHQILGIGILGSLISDIAAHALAALRWWTRDPGFREVKFLLRPDALPGLAESLRLQGFEPTELVQEYPPKLKGKGIKFQLRDGQRSIKYKFKQGQGTFTRSEEDARLVEILYETLREQLQITRKTRWWRGQWNGPGIKVDLYGTRFCLIEAVTSSRDGREDLELLPRFLRPLVLGVVDVDDRETADLQFDQLKARLRTPA